jgi:gamma-glutamylcyclotransferase
MTQTPSPTLHFGYGSNLWKQQMTERCPGHRILGAAKLRGYKWVISTRGYANVVESPGDEVEGVLYELTPSDEKTLDIREGVAVGSYSKVNLPVIHGINESTAMVYVDPIRAEGVAKAEYVKRINAGVKDAGLSAQYVTKHIRRFIPED